MQSSKYEKNCRHQKPANLSVMVAHACDIHIEEKQESQQKSFRL